MTVSGPVPSLTPAATQRLWSELVQRPRVHALTAADCRPLRAVFYAATDWLRLATKLAATPSSCAQYYISVPPLAADKTQLALRSGLADPRARAWRSTLWQRSTSPAGPPGSRPRATPGTRPGSRRGGAWPTAGYDVAAGDTWALNELSSAVRQGVGSRAREHARLPQRACTTATACCPPRAARCSSPESDRRPSDLSVYQARLQDWYEDADFWSDLSRYCERLVTGGLRRRPHLRRRRRYAGDARATR